MSTYYKPPATNDVPDWDDLVSSAQPTQPVKPVTQPKPKALPEQDYTDLARRISQEEEFDENITLAVMKQESAGKSKAVSNKGASGLMQLMPATAKARGVTDIFDPEQNIRAGVRELKQHYKTNNGDLDKTLASYNWGSGNLQKKGLRNAPKETRDYIKNIRTNLGGKYAPSTTQPQQAQDSTPDWDDLVSGMLPQETQPTNQPDSDIPDWDDLVSSKVSLRNTQSAQPKQTTTKAKSSSFNYQGTPLDLNFDKVNKQPKTIAQQIASASTQASQPTKKLSVGDLRAMEAKDPKYTQATPPKPKGGILENAKGAIAGVLDALPYLDPTNRSAMFSPAPIAPPIPRAKDFEGNTGYEIGRTGGNIAETIGASAILGPVTGTSLSMAKQNLLSNLEQQAQNDKDISLIEAAKETAKGATKGAIFGQASKLPFVNQAISKIAGKAGAGTGRAVAGALARPVLTGVENAVTSAPIDVGVDAAYDAVTGDDSLARNQYLTDPLNAVGRDLVTGGALGAAFNVPAAVKGYKTGGIQEGTRALGTGEYIAPPQTNDPKFIVASNDGRLAGAYEGANGLEYRPIPKEQAVNIATNSKSPIENVSSEIFNQRLANKQEPVPTQEPATPSQGKPILKPREASIKLTPEEDQALLDAETKYNNTLAFIEKYPGTNQKAINKSKGQALREFIATKKKILSKAQVERTDDLPPERTQKALPFDQTAPPQAPVVEPTKTQPQQTEPITQPRQDLAPKPVVEPAPTKDAYPAEVQAQLDTAKAKHKEAVSRVNQYSGGDKKYASKEKSRLGFQLSAERKQILANYEKTKSVEGDKIQQIQQVKPLETPKIPESVGEVAKPNQAQVVTSKNIPQNGQVVEQTQKPIIKPLAEGKTTKASTERGTEIEAKYALVDADDLITSNDTYLKENPNYPKELQPRDRSRAASEEQINRIAKQLKPEFLGSSAKASDGAPIVGDDMVVESGNGRSIALKRAYQEGGDSATKYKQYLLDNAGEFGLDPKAIAEAKAPVLVRVRQTQVDRAKFASEANETSVARMSASEQGKSDAAKIGKLLDNFQPSDDGDILTAANRQSFIPQFLDKVIGTAERGQYLDAKGNISQEGITRIKNAIFAKAYADTPEGASLLQKISESPDSNIRNIGGVLLKQAGKFATLKEDIANGNRYDLDISKDITAAVSKLSSLREQGQQVSDYLKQETMFGDDLSPLQKQILRAVDANKRSGKKLSDIFEQYTKLADSVGSPKQEGLFGKENVPTREELFELALKPNGQEKLFQRAKGTAVREPGELAKQAKYEPPKGITRADLRTTLLRTGLKDESGSVMNYKDLEAHIDKVMYVWDAMARSTGKTVDEFYQTSIREVRRSKGGVNDKGATQFLDNGQAVLKLFEKADVSTFNHEMFHILRRQLTASEHATLNTWLEQAGLPKVDGTNWKVAHEEYAARAFENFLKNGELPENAPSKLQRAFYQVKQWMGDIYNKLGDFGIKFAPGIKKQFSEVNFDEASSNIFKERLTKGAQQLEADAATQPKPASDGETATRQTYESAKPYLEKPLSQILEPESYTKLTNKKAFEEANKLIQSDPREALFLATTPQIEKGKAAIQNALSLELLRQAQSNGEIGKAQSIIRALAARGTEAGQAAQILSNISRISPEGVARYVDAQFTRLTDKISDGTRNKVEEVTKTLFESINDTPEQLSLLFQKQTGAPKPMLDKFTDKLKQAKNNFDREQVIKEFVSKRYGVPTLTAEATTKITQMAQDLQKLQGYDRKVAIAELKNYISEQIPQSIGKKATFLLRAFDLVNLPGGLANTLSDVLYSSPIGLESLTEQVASGVDRALTPIFKKAGVSEGRALVKPKFGEQLADFNKNRKTVWSEIKKGIDTTDVTENALGLGDSVPFTNPTAKKVGKLAQATVRTLYSLTQESSYRTTYNESIANQMRAAEKNGKKVTEPTEEMIEQAKKEAEQRTLTDKNWVTKSLEGAKNFLNGGKDFGLGTVFITYTKVPANIVKKGVEYSPAGFGKVGYQAMQAWRYKQTGGAKGAEFNQRDFVRSMARSLIGSGMVGTAFLLASAGVLVEQADDKDENKVKRLQSEEGLTGYKFNLDALGRLFSGGLKDKDATKVQPGDRLVDYNWLGAPAFLMNLGANLNKNIDKATEAKPGSGWDIAKAITDSGKDSLTDSSLIQALGKIGAVGDLFDKSKGSAVDKTLSSIATRPIPATAKQVRNYFDNTRRETYEPDSLTQTIINNYKNAIPGLSSSLPASKGAFGEDKEKVVGGSSLMSSFITGGKIQTYKGSPEIQYAIDLFDARKPGDKRDSHVPSAPQELKDNSGKKVALSAFQRGQYAELVGKGAEDLYQRVMASKNFEQLSADGKGEFIADYLEQIAQKAKSRVLDSKLKPSQERKLASILPKNNEVLEHNIGVKVAQEKALASVETDPKLKKLYEGLNESQKEQALKNVKNAYENLLVKEDPSDPQGVQTAKLKSQQALLPSVQKLLAAKIVQAKAFRK